MHSENSKPLFLCQMVGPWIDDKLVIVSATRQSTVESTISNLDIPML